MNSLNHIPQNTDKKYMREYYTQKRKELLQNIDEKTELDLEIQSRLLISDEYRKCETILIYCSRDFEIDTMGIINLALLNKKQVALPKCETSGEISFYIINSLDDLEKGSFNIFEPKKHCKKLTDFSAALCVAPCLCCDMQGYRLGFGKGYYDRFLQNFEGNICTLCYSDSIIPQMEHNEFDIPVNAVVTDKFLRHIIDNQA